MKNILGQLTLGTLALSALASSAQAAPETRWYKIATCTATGFENSEYQSFDLDIGLNRQDKPVAVRGERVQQGHLSEAGEYIHGWVAELSGKTAMVEYFPTEEDTEIFNVRVHDGKIVNTVEGDVQEESLGLISLVVKGGKLDGVTYNSESPAGDCTLVNAALLKKISIEIDPE